MAYRSELQAAVLQGRSVLNVALDVHMATTGSAENFNYDASIDVALLKDILQSWKPGKSRFDEAVKILLESAIEEFEEKQEEYTKE